MKHVIIIGLLIILLIFLFSWTFNHVNPWIAFLLAAAGFYGILFYVNKKLN